MLKTFFKNTIIKNRALIRRESAEMRDFMSLLMKHRNTNVRWSPDEIRELKAHLVHLSFYVPVFIVFSLPGGTLLLPLLAEVLDRREKLRHQ
jgi:hypothetical protein